MLTKLRIMAVTGVALLGLAGPAIASNIAVTNVAMMGQVADSTWQVQFDLSWVNSWRKDSVPPYNYDAAWVFVKWRTISGSTSAWYHATFSTNAADHTAPAGSTIAVGASGRTGAWGSNGMGVFIYRAADGAGPFTANQVRLRWNYAADGAGGGAKVELKVCAIEMVYMPVGAFYLGSGGGEMSHFYRSDGTAQTTTPYQVLSETNAITVSSSSGNLYYASSVAGGDQAGVISNVFPKGYGAFYGMKYEISQRQYADFLNTLPPSQATNRWSAASAGNRYAIANVGGVYISTNPYVACNWLSWADGAAYADWAGLRPMTELEYEKVCRGPAYPVANEYAWGTAVIIQATNIANAGQSNEMPQSAANCAYGNNAKVPGPMRVGCMGVGSGVRMQTGAGYYGMMELTGNVWERTVTVGTNTGRAFMGMHGDGALTTVGDANVTDWPGTNSSGTGMRGGSWAHAGTFAWVSDRFYGSIEYPTRDTGNGWRAVRSAP